MFSGSVRQIYNAKSRGFRQISHSQINHSQFDLAQPPPPPVCHCRRDGAPVFCWTLAGVFSRQAMGQERALQGLPCLPPSHESPSRRKVAVLALLPWLLLLPLWHKAPATAEPSSLFLNAAGTATVAVPRSSMPNTHYPRGIITLRSVVPSPALTLAQGRIPPRASNLGIVPPPAKRQAPSLLPLWPWLVLVATGSSLVALVHHLFTPALASGDQQWVACAAAAQHRRRSSAPSSFSSPSAARTRGRPRRGPRNRQADDVSMRVPPQTASATSHEPSGDVSLPLIFVEGKNDKLAVLRAMDLPNKCVVSLEGTNAIPPEYMDCPQVRSGNAIILADPDFTGLQLRNTLDAQLKVCCAP